MTIQGLPGDTININGTLDLGGGSLKVTGDMIHVAGSIKSAGGSVDLDAGSQGTLVVSGRIDVSDPAAGHVGGSVQLLGEGGGVLDGATIDASGAAGGGSVLIGGDMHGANPNVHDAQQTYVDAGASIAASALDSGNGGKVVVWANDSTQFSGTIVARGGSHSGNGGTVESFRRQGRSVVRRQRRSFGATRGTDGSLLLDPATLNIDSTEAALIVTQLNTGNVSLNATNLIDVQVTVDTSADLGSNSLTLTAPSILLETGVSIITHGGALTLAGNVTLASAASDTLSTAPPALTTGGNLQISGTLYGTRVPSRNRSR